MPPKYGGTQWGRIWVSEFEKVAKAVTPAQLSVYMFLALKRNSKSVKTPPIGVSLIESSTNLSRRTVFNALALLTKKGFLTKATKGNLAVYGFPLVDSPSSEDQG